MIKNPDPCWNVFSQNPTEIWSNVSTLCENVTNTTTEMPWKWSVHTVYHAERCIFKLGSTLSKICVPGSLEAPEKSPTRAVSCLFDLNQFQIYQFSSMSKGGLGICTRVEASISRWGSYIQTPKEPAFPGAEPSWTDDDHRCLEKVQHLSENKIHDGLKISSKSARTKADDLEPVRCCREFCGLYNHVTEEQDELGPTPPGDDKGV